MKKNLPPKFYHDISHHMADFAQSIKHLKIVNFFHDITFGHGKISMLSANFDMFQFYYYHQIPVVCTNDAGRILPDGIYLNKVLAHQYDEYSTLLTLLHDAGLKHQSTLGKNALHYVINEQDCQHMYSLFFDVDDHDFLHFIVNNTNLIQDVIYDYHRKNKDIILEAKSPQNRIFLPSASDFVWHNGRYQLSKNAIDTYMDNLNNFIKLSPSQIDAFLTKKKYPIKSDNINITLSKMEMKTILELLKGKHAGEIAHILEIKQTTVESYLLNIKNKFGIRLKSELIHKLIHSQLLQKI